MKIVVIFSLFLFALYSCGKNDSYPPTNVSGTEYATLKVTAENFYSGPGNTQIDSPMTKAVVSIFGSLNDYLDNENVLAAQACDATGSATFSGLTESTYYVTVKHPTLGTQEKEVNTPLNAITQLQVTF